MYVCMYNVYCIVIRNIFLYCPKKKEKSALWSEGFMANKISKESTGMYNVYCIVREIFFF